MCWSLLASVEVTESHTTEPYSNLDLTAVKYSIMRLFREEKESVTVQIKLNT
jgi:hypothetical protein